nr:hypothetical protein [Evansella caseinilytica]
MNTLTGCQAISLSGKMRLTNIRKPMNRSLKNSKAFATDKHGRAAGKNILVLPE